MKTQILNIVNKPWFLPTMLAVSAFASGFACGHIHGRRLFTSDAKNVSEKLEQLELDFQKDMKTINPEWPRSIHRIPSIVEDKEEEIEIKPLVHGYPYVRTPGIEWNYDEECAKRTPLMPYFIHQDEFMDNESGYIQGSLIYYAKDATLADEKDELIEEPIKWVGELKFGYGSADERICFKRNEKLQLEWEIIKHDTSYQEEVLGEEIQNNLSSNDLKHSIRKFKLD